MAANTNAAKMTFETEKPMPHNNIMMVAIAANVMPMDHRYEAAPSWPPSLTTWYTTLGVGPGTGEEATITMTRPLLVTVVRGAGVVVVYEVTVVVPM